MSATHLYTCDLKLLMFNLIKNLYSRKLSFRTGSNKANMPSLVGTWIKTKKHFKVYFDVDSTLCLLERVPVYGPSPVREYFCYLWSAGRHLEGGPIRASQKLHLGGG